MKKRILFGTGNQAKLARIRSVVSDLPLEIIGIRDLHIDLKIDENGNDVHENALKKARAYFLAAGLPAFSIDTGLYIDGFPDDKQPGIFVRRINGRRATDQEMLEYYSRELENIGGQSKGRWISSVTFVIRDDLIKQYELVEKRIFISACSEVLIKDSPLSSLAIDPTFNKYVSEISGEERRKLQEETDREIYNIFTETLSIL